MISKLIKSSFIKDVSSLSSGIIAAHIVTILASLFITRIYEPADIGYLTFFASLSIVFANISTLGYELAIVTAKKKSTSIYLTSGVVLLLLFFSIFLLIGILISQYFGLVPDVGIPAEWLVFLPLGVIVTGFINIGQEWFNFTKQYKFLASTKVVQSVSIAVPQIVLGILFSANIGLLIGFLLGRLIASLLYIYNYIRKQLWKLISINKIKRTLLRYSQYPKYVASTLIFDRLSLEAPFFLISILFSESVLGYYAIAYKVLSLPLNFLGTAIGKVFFKHLADKKNKSTLLAPSLIKTWLTLAAIGILPMFVILFGGEVLFEFVFGDGWGYSGTLAILLVPMLYLDFISSPTGRSFLVLELEHYTPVFSIARLAYIAGSLYVGYVMNEILLGILLLSLSRSIALIIQNVILFVKVKHHDYAISSINTRTIS